MKGWERRYNRHGELGGPDVRHFPLREMSQADRARQAS